MELAPLAQALFGYPLHFLVRALDNPRVDPWSPVTAASAGLSHREEQSARAVLKVLAAGARWRPGHHNTLLAEGRICRFFRHSGCTTLDWLDLRFIPALP